MTKQEMEAVVADVVFRAIRTSPEVFETITYAKDEADSTFLVKHRGEDYRVTVTKESA